MLRTREEIEERIRSLLADERSADLVELALLVGAHSRPDEVDVEISISEVDQLASNLDGNVDDLLTFLFHDLGFDGDRTDYYSVDNSHMDVVLRRRVGIPLTLAIVVCAVGARAGINLETVGLPGHVVVGTADGSRFFDVFDKGRSLSRDECSRIVATLHPGLALTDSMLEPLSQRAVLTRMLNNLIGVHQRDGARHELLRLARLRTLVSGDESGEVREVAAAMAARGQLSEAADELERAAEDMGADVASVLLTQATRYRARLN